MIYIVDDKTKRQKDYGWGKERFDKFASIVKPISTFAELEKNEDEMLSKNSIILFHESFHDSIGSNEQTKLKKIEDELDTNKKSLYIARFSGSSSTRWIDEESAEGRYCALPPDVLYENLETFINHVNEGVINFRYLLFGENYQVEEDIRAYISAINDKNAEDQAFAETDQKLFFAINFDSDLSIIPPFDNYKSDDAWDFYDQNVTDADLDELVNKWFLKEEFDGIYIPLCFGPVLSDFLGLRLAMHIRFSDTPNQYKPIFIYGFGDWKLLSRNECFDILKTKGVSYILPSNESFYNSIKDLTCTSKEDWSKDLRNVHVNIPSNIGDNHSVANKWAIHRWYNMIDWEGDLPEYQDDDFYKSLYFKYLESAFGKHDNFSKKKKYSWRIDGLKGAKIAYVDDEYNRGWEAILGKLFKKNGAELYVYKDFDKVKDQKDLKVSIEKFLDAHPSDCYLIDLRLDKKVDFEKNRTKGLSGQSIISYLLGKDKDNSGKGNMGNKVIVFTASNKVWNMQEAMTNGACGYYIKESPEFNYTRTDTINSFVAFVRLLKSSVAQSYIRDYLDRLSHLHTHYGNLEGFFNLLVMDSSVDKKDSLKSLLIKLIVFFEDYIEKEQGFNFTQEDLFYKNDLKITGYKMKSLLLKSEGKHHTDFKFGYLSPEMNNDGWEAAEVKNKKGLNNPLALVEAALHYYYRIDQNKIDNGKEKINPCKFYFKMKMQRNIAAHSTEPLDITINDIKLLFEKVILPCMEKDDKMQN